MSYLNTPQPGAPTTPIGPAARQWAPLIGFLAGLLVLTLIGAVAALRPAAQAQPTGAIIMIATATAAPSPTTAPRAILARWDYANPLGGVAIITADVVRIVGRADGWYLVEVQGGSRVWVSAADVPVGVPSDNPLPDLEIKPTPIIIYVPVPIEQAAPTAETHFEMPSTRPGPPLYTGETLEEYLQRTNTTPVAVQQSR